MSDQRRRGLTRRAAGSLCLEPAVIDIRSHLDGLGPVGSSFALYLASRLDLLSPACASEIAVNGSPGGALEGEELHELIRKDLGLPVDQAFDDFDSTPFDISLRFQWHRGHLHTGEAVVIKVIHRALSRQLESGLDRIGSLRSSLADLCGDRTDEVIADFGRDLEHSLDLSREMNDLVRLRDESGCIDRLTVPEVICNLSGQSCLTILSLEGSTVAERAAIPGDRASTINERLARRLARVWLKIALGASLIPQEPTGRNVLLLANGDIAICGGPFHAPSSANQSLVRDYLTATTVSDHEQACENLLALSDKRSAADRQQLRHQLRHSAPFRDGSWDSTSDLFSRTVFAHWHRMSVIGYRPHPTLLAFLRGLSHLAGAAHRLAPGQSALHQAFQEYRLRHLLAEIGDLPDREEWAGMLHNQAQLLSDLPRKLDRLLSAASDGESHRSPEPQTDGNSDSRPWLVVGSLLAAMSATALLVHELAGVHVSVEPIGALLLLALGGLVLRSAGRP